jgi:hypothetical protein
MAGRGRKLNLVKNERAHADWMAGKKIGRPKQQYVFEGKVSPDGTVVTNNHWEKVSR